MPTRNCRHKRIQLTQDMYAIVDEADYKWLRQWKWCATTNSKKGKYYAARGVSVDGHCHTKLMHREIIGAKKGQLVDHIDGDSLNNCRLNMRFCDASQNQYNTPPYRKNKTSKFKGVCWNKDSKKWVVRIRRRNKLFHLGYFHSEIEAAQAYNKAAKKYHGEFAWLNALTPLERKE